MTTWTFKGPIAALALFALSACEGGQGGGLLAGLANGQKAKPLSQTTLAGGAVTLKAPRGFCIDSKSITEKFALMARCDVLGAPQAAGDAPLGFITVSVQSATPGAPLPTVEQLAAASGLSAVSDPQTADGQLTFRASGRPPIKGVSGTHWRGTVGTNGKIVGVSLHAPESGRALTDEGRSIVSEVLSRSRGGS